MLLVSSVVALISLQDIHIIYIYKLNTGFVYKVICDKYCFVNQNVYNFSKLLHKFKLYVVYLYMDLSHAKFWLITSSYR